MDKIFFVIRGFFRLGWWTNEHDELRWEVVVNSGNTCISIIVDFIKCLIPIYNQFKLSISMCYTKIQNAENSIN
jgi:hypothetical protein